MRSPVAPATRSDRMSRGSAQPRVGTGLEPLARAPALARRRRLPPPTASGPTCGRDQALGLAPTGPRLALRATNQNAVTMPKSPSVRAKARKASVSPVPGKLRRTATGQARQGVLGWASILANNAGACATGTSIHRPRATKASSPPVSHTSNEEHKPAPSTTSVKRSRL